MGNHCSKRTSCWLQQFWLVSWLLVMGFGAVGDLLGSCQAGLPVDRNYRQPPVLFDPADIAGRIALVRPRQRLALAATCSGA